MVRGNGWNHRHLDVACDTELTLNTLLDSCCLFQLVICFLQLFMGLSQMLLRPATIDGIGQEESDHTYQRDACPQQPLVCEFSLLFGNLCLFLLGSVDRGEFSSIILL